MAKHNIQGTSTVCSASQHSWLPGLTTNYRQCRQCRTVEVLVDGQWLPPTGRKRVSPSAVAPAPSLMVVKDQDLQAKMTRLVDMPSHSSTVSLSQGSTVSLSQGSTVSNGRERVFEPVEASYDVASSALMIDSDLGAHWHRERIYQLAGERNWETLSLKFQVDRKTSYESSYIIAGGEPGWRRFAEKAGYTMIIRAMAALELLSGARGAITEEGVSGE